MAITRVHLLAKELGVGSKAIIEKCQAEGLDVKNHMSTISAGLAATIREWFSEGTHTTAVETAAPVDLVKARVKKKKKIEPKPQEEETVPVPVEQTAEPQTAIQEPAASQAAVVAEAAPPKKVAEPQVGRAVPKHPPVAVPEIMKEPPKPALPVIPAGPKLGKPRPAKLSGPRVVRVEKPEEMDRHRPKPRFSSKPAYKQQATEPLLASAPGIAETQSKTGKGKKKTHGRRHDDTIVGEEPLRLQKTARKLLTRDIEERRARL